jgi:hypothetical protein
MGGICLHEYKALALRKHFTKYVLCLFFVYLCLRIESRGLPYFVPPIVLVSHHLHQQLICTT